MKAFEVGLATILGIWLGTWLSKYAVEVSLAWRMNPHVRAGHYTLDGNLLTFHPAPYACPICNNAGACDLNVRSRLRFVIFAVRRLLLGQ